MDFPFHTSFLCEGATKVLLMACELTFSTPTERGLSQIAALWGWGSYGPWFGHGPVPQAPRPKSGRLEAKQLRTYVLVVKTGIEVPRQKSSRWARRHQPRRRRPFRYFFSRLGLVLDTDSGFGLHDGRRTTDETELTPDPIPRTGNRQNFIAKKFKWRFQKCFLLEHGGTLLKRFGCIMTMDHCFPVLEQMGPL